MYLVLSLGLGWEHHRSIERNKRAIDGSLFIATARHESKLVGIIRLVGDGAYILHIADMSIRKEYQRKGIGRQLLEIAKGYAKSTDVGCGLSLGEFTLFANIDSIEFYKSLGFKSCPNGMVLTDCPKRQIAEEEFQKQWLAKQPL